MSAMYAHQLSCRNSGSRCDPPCGRLGCCCLLSQCETRFLHVVTGPLFEGEPHGLSPREKVESRKETEERWATGWRLSLRGFLLSTFFPLLSIAFGNRDNKTAIELFWQGLDGWDTGLRRQLENRSYSPK